MAAAHPEVGIGHLVPLEPCSHKFFKRKVEVIWSYKGEVIIEVGTNLLLLQVQSESLQNQNCNQQQSYSIPVQCRFFELHSNDHLVKLFANLIDALTCPSSKINNFLPISNSIQQSPVL